MRWKTGCYGFQETSRSEYVLRFPSARISDAHACPIHGGGAIVTGFPTVLVGSMPASRITDIAMCGPIPNALVSGSMTVLIGKSPASRITESLAHGGKVVSGFPTVLIGDKGGGPVPPAHGPVGGMSRQAAALLAAQASNAPLCEVCSSV